MGDGAVAIELQTAAAADCGLIVWCVGRAAFLKRQENYDSSMARACERHNRLPCARRHCHGLPHDDQQDESAVSFESMRVCAICVGAPPCLCHRIWVYVCARHPHKSFSKPHMERDGACTDGRIEETIGTSEL